MRLMVLKITGKNTIFFGGLNDPYPGIDCKGGEASDSGLLGAVYVAAIDDATVHQDAVDTSDANNVFTLFVTFVARSNV